MKGPTKSFLFIVAVASGAASLLYEAVWMRRMALTFGNTAFVTAAAILSFLGGMAIGTWIWGRLADRRPRSSLTIFAALEFATGVYGFASLWILHGVETLYLALYLPLADHTSTFAVAKFVLSALVILPAAILIGGFLPLLARRVLSDDSGTVDSAGAVYGWSVLGAALGAVMTIYGLLPALGLTSTVLLAAAVNVVVSVAAFSAEMCSRRRPEPLNAAASMHSSGLAGESSEQFTKILILIGFAISGFAVVIFQVACARLIAMVVGSSVYVYSVWVAVVLTGIGLGSILYGRTHGAAERHQRRLAELEFLLALAAALAMIVLQRIPYLFAHFFPLFRNSFGRQIAAQFLFTAIGALLPALLFGAMFPAAIGSLGGVAARFGGAIGAAYIANTIGVLAGACLAEFSLIPAIGLHATMNVGVLAAVGAGFAVWWGIRAPKLRRLPALTPALAALLVVALLPSWPREAFAAGIGFIAPRLGPDETLNEIVKRMQLLYYRDGRAATISVDETGRTLFFRSNGKTVASTDPVDMASQLLLGHLPMLLHPAPRDILMLGLSTGLTAAAVARYPAQRIDVVEPEPAVAQAAKLFDSYTRKVLDDPRVHLIIGDGRNRLLVVPKQYDVVISEACDAWIAGAGSLATREFYRIVGGRLNPGGIFAQCVHTQALRPDDLDFLAATFHSVFPHMQIWTSAPGNLILLGTRDSVVWDYTRLQKGFTQIQGVADDLNSMGIWRPFALFGAQILGEKESDAFNREIDEFNTDNRPALEFRAPRSLYVETTSSIAKELNPFRRPDAPAIAGFDPQRDLDAEGTYLLGFAYASMGQPDLAIRYMERSTAMAPDRAMFFVGLGNQYRAAGRILDARGAYERALKRDLNNVEALVSLGEIRLDEGQLDWTRVLSERALQLAPQDARVHDLIDRLQEAEH